MDLHRTQLPAHPSLESLVNASYVCLTSWRCFFFLLKKIALQVYWDCSINGPSFSVAIWLQSMKRKKLISVLYFDSFSTHFPDSRLTGITGWVRIWCCNKSLFLSLPFSPFDCPLHVSSSSSFPFSVFAIEIIEMINYLTLFSRRFLPLLLVINLLSPSSSDDNDNDYSSLLESIFDCVSYSLFFLFHPFSLSEINI